jgi:5'-phosphate synthase pdxT subunit
VNAPRGDLTVGVLALQGAVDAHRAALTRCGVASVAVRVPGDLEGLDGIILPGGESTTMSMMLERNGLSSELATAARSLPVFGTCAGLILVASEIVDGRDDQISLGLLDSVVVRNGYGRQVASTEVDLDVEGLSTPFRAVFIRAPRITAVGDAVEVLASLNGDPVLVRSGALLACAFHPELTGDDRLHEMFIDMCETGPVRAMMNTTAPHAGDESKRSTRGTV